MSNPVNDYMSQAPKKITKKMAYTRMLVAQTLMNKGQETTVAKDIIDGIKYLTLATSNDDSVPWSTPVFFAHNGKYNFYWISEELCVHSINIAENSNIAFVIYDSRAPEGKGIGVYVKAKAYALTNRKEIEEGLKLLYKRMNKTAPQIADFMEQKLKRVYKAVPSAVWVNDLKEKAGAHKYIRIEIDLNDTTA